MLISNKINIKFINSFKHIGNQALLLVLLLLLLFSGCGCIVISVWSCHCVTCAPSVKINFLFEDK